MELLGCAVSKVCVEDFLRGVAEWVVVGGGVTEEVRWGVAAVWCLALSAPHISQLVGRG